MQNEIEKVNPQNFELLQNYPNPFSAGGAVPAGRQGSAFGGNPTTTITFKLPRGAQVRLEVFSVLGKIIRRLADGPLNAGIYSVEWDGRDDGGQQVASGVYFNCLLIDGRFVHTRRLSLIR